MSKKESLINETGICEADYDWFMKSRFFGALGEDTKFRLLQVMRRKRLGPGKRLMAQGEEGDYFCIIRHGKCVVNMEKEGVNHFVGRLGAGDIVGEMAILTGDKRSANVDSESELEIWIISRQDFDKACADHPDLKKFLTKIVADRLASALLRSERAIGKYVAEKAIGEGGCSIIYKGHHPGLGMPVAIKMLRHNMAMDQAFFDLFRNEAQTIALLNHENIVKVYDIEELYRTFFVVMEYIEGVSLKDLLSGSPAPSLQRKVDILLQICAGLLHAHEKGVIHRDIKPGNILIHSNDKVKIVDFGVACSPGSVADYITGTARYVAPEQVRGDPVDERTDIYALGLMAYEMFTGHRACQGATLREMFLWHLKNEVDDPLSYAADLPEELRAFLIQACRRDPEERHKNIRHCLRSLEPLADRLGVSSSGGIHRDLNMMSLFLFYRSEQHEMMQQLVRDFRRELEKIGARLRGADFKNVED